MFNRYNLSESKCRIFNGSKPLSSSTQQRERVNTTNHNHTQSFSNRPETDIWTLVGFDDDAAFKSLERIHKILVSELKYVVVHPSLTHITRNVQNSNHTSNILEYQTQVRGGRFNVTTSTQKHGCFQDIFCDFEFKEEKEIWPLR